MRVSNFGVESALKMDSDCVTFLSEPSDSLKCLICLEVAEEPRQHEKCGRLFCRACLEKYGKMKPCPYCMYSQPQYFEDNRSKRDIQDLRVSCANVGCHWEGTIATAEKHNAACEFSLVCCPKDCEDGRFCFMRKNIPQHLLDSCPNRDFECVHCGKKGDYSDITQVHDEKCEKKILLCPNANCTITMQRRGMKRHLDVCDHTEIPCKYQKLAGCGVKIKRSALPTSHEEDDKLHLQMALDKIAAMQHTMATMFTEKESLTFELTEYRNRKDKDEAFRSPPFYTSPKGYHIEVTVYPMGAHSGVGTHISIYAAILDGKYDAMLEWPFEGSITCVLLNQLEDRNHLKKEIVLKGSTGSSLGFSKCFALSKLDCDEALRTQYLKDDKLYFQVSAKVKSHKRWLDTGVHKSRTI